MNTTVKRVLIGTVIAVLALAAIHIALNWEQISETVRQLHGG